MRLTEESRRLSGVPLGQCMNEGVFSEAGAWWEEHVRVSWGISGLGVGTELGSSEINHALASPTALRLPYPVPTNLPNLPRIMLSAP